MYCQNCGLQLRDNAESCPSCEQSCRQPSVEYKSNFLLDFLTRPPVFATLILAILLVLSTGLLALYQKVNLPDPTQTVEKFYLAVENKEKNTALECVHPDQRESGLGFNIELLLQPSVTIEYSDLKFKTIEKDKDTARVRVTGKATLLIEGKTREVIFNDEAVLKTYSRDWFLDSTSLGDLFVL